MKLYNHPGVHFKMPFFRLSVYIYARMSVCPSLRYDDGYISESLESQRDLFLKFILRFRIIRDVYSMYVFLNRTRSKSSIDVYNLFL